MGQQLSRSGGATDAGLPAQGQAPVPNSPAEGSASAPSLNQTLGNVHVVKGTINIAGRDNITVNNVYGVPGPNEIQQLQEIATWLTPINFRDILAMNLDKRTPYTGDWFTGGPNFERWLCSSGGLLWCTGMPGAGKTMLSSIAIDYLQKRAEADPGTMSVSFAFCRYTEPLSVREILAALVRQNIETHPRLLSCVMPLYNQHRRTNTKPSQTELIRLLTEFTSYFKVNIYGLDGLDEAMDEAQFSLVEILSSLNVHFLITSRPLQRLEAEFPHANHLEVAAHTEDIATYVNQAVASSPRLKALLKDKDFKADVMQKIQAKSAGMFLHASLQMAMLRQCLTISEIERALEEFPNDLDEMYEATIQRIEQQGSSASSAAKRLLAWVVCARRPMTIHELQDALATCMETGTIDSENKIDQEDLLALSCGLIVVETNSDEQTARLVHYTAKDVLEPWLAKQDPSPDALLAVTCVARLTACGVQNCNLHSLKSHFRKEGGLFQYAYRNWAYHTRRCTHPGTLRRLEDFVIGCTSFPVAHRGGMFLDHHNNIQLSAYLGLTSILQYLLDTEASRCNERATYFGHFPLALACQAGQSAAAFALLDQPGIDVNCESTPDSTPLQLAVSSDSKDIVQALIGHPELNVNAANSHGYTPLMFASSLGLLDIVQLLLAHSKTIPSLKCEWGADAATMAKEGGHVEIVRMILDHPEAMKVYPTDVKEALIENAQSVWRRRLIPVPPDMTEPGAEPSFYQINSS